MCVSMYVHVCMAWDLPLLLLLQEQAHGYLSLKSNGITEWIIFIFLQKQSSLNHPKTIYLHYPQNYLIRNTVRLKKVHENWHYWLIQISSSLFILFLVLFSKKYSLMESIEINQNNNFIWISMHKCWCDCLWMIRFFLFIFIFSSLILIDYYIITYVFCAFSQFIHYLYFVLCVFVHFDLFHIFIIFEFFVCCIAFDSW